MPYVDLSPRSPAEAAATEALVDIAPAIDDWRDVRIVGGHMVRIHTPLHAVAPRSRQTVDADVLASVAVIGSSGLAARAATRR